MAIGALALSLYFFGIFEYLNFEKLRALEQALMGFVIESPVFSVLLFAIVYIVIVISMFPGLFALELVAGYLFGQIIGFLVVVSSAVFGATLLFLSAKYAFGDRLLKRDSKIVHKIKKGFDRNQSSYLLFLRIFPFVPFGLVNIALGFLDVKLKRFIWTTALGVCPLAFVLTQVGTGLGKILQMDEAISIGSILSGRVIFSMIALGVLTLVPVVFKRRKKIAND